MPSDPEVARSRNTCGLVAGRTASANVSGITRHRQSATTPDASRAETVNESVHDLRSSTHFHDGGS